MKDNPHVAALKIARRYIASGKERFVCCTLQYRIIENPRVADDVRVAARKIKLWIQGQIKSSGPVELWLAKNGIPTHIHAGNEIRRQYRLNWIDHLIEKWK